MGRGADAAQLFDIIPCKQGFIAGEITSKENTLTSEQTSVKIYI